MDDGRAERGKRAGAMADPVLKAGWYLGHGFVVMWEIENGVVAESSRASGREGDDAFAGALCGP